MFAQVVQLLQELRAKKPLILHVTNVVTMDFVANGLLSLGASPIMCQATEELAELLQISQALVINLGTLNTEFIALCRHAGQLANAMRIPIILDPVGAGASTLRTTTARQLLKDYQIAIVRGNASEIAALSGADSVSKGVDSLLASPQAWQSAVDLARATAATIIISGATDYIVQAGQTMSHQRGSAYLPSVTGAGCLLTSVVAAFHALSSDPFVAAYASTLFYSICGEIAAAKAAGPGSFRLHFIDALNGHPQRNHYDD